MIQVPSSTRFFVHPQMAYYSVSSQYIKRSISTVLYIKQDYIIQVPFPNTFLCPPTSGILQCLASACNPLLSNSQINCPIVELFFSSQHIQQQNQLLVWLKTTQIPICK